MDRQDRRDLFIGHTLTGFLMNSHMSLAELERNSGKVAQAAIAVANAVMMQLGAEEDGVEPPKEESADDTQA